MAVEQTHIVAVTPQTPATANSSVRYLEWGPVIAGAFAAAAISFVLLTFGAAVGLTMTSPWPNSGWSIVVVAIIVAVWTALVQIAAYAAGGYLAGRMRSRWGESGTEEGRFRDGAHGFTVWAVGVVVSALVLAVASGAGLRIATQAVSQNAVGAATGVGAGVGDRDPTRYDLAVDLLLRPAPAAETAGAPPAGAAAPATTQARGQAATTPAGEASFRAEAGRLLAETIRTRELTAADRSYLASEIMRRDNIPRAEAEKRVDAAVMRARDIELRTRELADKARRGSVLAAFLAAATLLISCAAACAGAIMGGKGRDEGTPAIFAGHRIW